MLTDGAGYDHQRMRSQQGIWFGLTAPGFSQRGFGTSEGATTATGPARQSNVLSRAR